MNGARPPVRLWRLAVMAAVLALAVLLGGVALTQAPEAVALTNCSVDASIDGEEQEFLRLINEHRAAHGLPPLALSQSLTRSAAWKSNDMAQNNYFAHDDITIGRSWSQRIRDCGYTANTYLGENIAAGNSSAAATFQQWRNSPGHNANMLSANYSAIGIGRAYDASSQYGWYWTTNFGGVVDEVVSPGGVGDVSCDGIVNALDAALILQYVAGLTSSLPCPDQGDTNGDGEITAADALLILQFNAGMVTAFPV